MTNNIKKFRRAANFGLYGSILVVLLTVVFHFSPFTIAPQSPEVSRWMLIAGTVLAVLAIVMVLQVVRRTTPRLRQLDNIEQKIQGYTDYICNLYRTTFGIVLAECILIVLMSDNSLLMVTILLVLMLFLCYPNMYKMRNDLGLTDNEMKQLFGDTYIADPQPEEAEEDETTAENADSDDPSNTQA